MKMLLLAALTALAPWNATASRLHQYATEAAVLGRFNGVILAARGDQVYSEAFGYADMATHRPNTMQTQFEIASLTKMFTAAAILKLRDEGRLSLGDSICKYFASCPDRWRAVTIAQTLHHRSGIPDYENALGMESDEYFAFMSRPDNVQRIIEKEAPLPLDFAPGKKFSYSNTGYIVLAYIVQAASHQSFAAYVHSRIFAPAKMTQTGVMGVDRPGDLATGYLAAKTGWKQLLAGFNPSDAGLRQVPGLPLGNLHGDGSLFSTAGDLYRWGRIMLGKGPAIFSPAERAEIFTSEEGYGDGWMIGDQYGLTRYRHTGEIPGFLSNIALYPDRDTIVIMLDNVDTNMRVITRDINAIAVGAPYDLPVHGTVVTLTGAQKARLAGSYAFSDGSVACVDANGPLVSISVPNQYAAGLIAMSARTFYMPLSGGTASFTATGLNLRYDGVDHTATRAGTSCIPWKP